MAPYSISNSTTITAPSAGPGNHAQARRCMSEPPPRRVNAEIVATMKVFGVDLDIDAAERQKRQVCRENTQQQRIGNEGAVMALRVADIEGVLKKKHFPGTLSDAASILPDVSQSWDLPVTAKADRTRVGKSSKAGRRPFFEQTHWAGRWAELMDRPRRGMPNAAWQAETKPDIRPDNDIPAEVNLLLDQLKRDFRYALAKQRSRSAKPVSNFAEESFVEELRNSLQHVLKKDEVPGSSRASTASGDTPVFDIEASSPEVLSTSPGTATPDITDSEDGSVVNRVFTDSQNGSGVFHIVNDPKGQHALLQSKSNDVATSCQPLRFPLAFRRAMCAALPADPKTSLQLSHWQMNRLSDLRGVIETQKQRSSARKVAQFPQRSRRDTQRSVKP